MKFISNTFTLPCFAAPFLTPHLFPMSVGRDWEWKGSQLFPTFLGFPCLHLTPYGMACEAASSEAAYGK
jgi:hypothetical protein